MSRERTLEELKAEAQARADRNGYPLIGLKPDEVREALSRLKSLARSRLMYPHGDVDGSSWPR